MRAPPQPPLQNVLVARPGTGPGTVARRDDLLAAAVLAAEDAHDTRSRPRSVLARVSRGWSRFSDALRRRRKDEKRPREVVTAQVVRLDHRGRVTVDPAHDAEVEQIKPAPSHVILHRERELRVARMESDMDAEMAVSSLRDPSQRRVRQVGARDDDDTLLMLPRVAAVSLSQADKGKESAHDAEGKRVQLPRVSALMPTRAPSRPTSGLGSGISSDSPVSSAGNTLSTRDHPSDDGSHTSSDSEDGYDDERRDTWDVAEHYMGRRAFCRLPTGLSNKDVEREIDRAVVEIASDGDSDEDSDEASEEASDEEEQPQRLRPSTQHVEITKSRALSDAHHPVQSLKPDIFSRRASSTMQAKRQVFEDDDREGHSPTGENSRFRPSEEIAMFEDDYLSFQGFQTRPSSDARSHQSMASILRSKRISSVTDSLSEESEEASNLRGTKSTDSRNRRERSGLLSPKMLRKRQVLTDAMDGL